MTRIIAVLMALGSTVAQNSRHWYVRLCTPRGYYDNAGQLVRKRATISIDLQAQCARFAFAHWYDVRARTSFHCPPMSRSRARFDERASLDAKILYFVFLKTRSPRDRRIPRSCKYEFRRDPRYHSCRFFMCSVYEYTRIVLLLCCCAVLRVVRRTEEIPDFLFLVYRCSHALRRYTNTPGHITYHYYRGPNAFVILLVQIVPQLGHGELLE